MHGKSSRVGKVFQYLALLAYLVFLAFPLVWLLSTSFKPPVSWSSCTRR